MGHVDFTSYALIEGRRDMFLYWSDARPALVESRQAVNRYISNFFAAFLTQDRESRAFLAQDPKESIPGSTVSLEHRPAAPASITHEEFVQAVVAGQADDAIDEIRKLRESQPDYVFLNDDSRSKARLEWLRSQ